MVVMHNSACHMLKWSLLGSAQVKVFLKMFLKLCAIYIQIQCMYQSSNPICIPFIIVIVHIVPIMMEADEGSYILYERMYCLPVKRHLKSRYHHASDPSRHLLQSQGLNARDLYVMLESILGIESCHSMNYQHEIIIHCYGQGSL